MNIILTDRINPAIVECKVSNKQSAAIKRHSINPAIVECKDRIVSVLRFYRVGINPAIVECKVKKGLHALWGQEVLIRP